MRISVPKMLKVALVALFLVLFCSGAYVVRIMIDCERAKVAPEVQVYPGSMLIHESLEGVGLRTRPIVTRYYKSMDSPNTIVEFYQKQGICGLGENLSQTGHELCRGNATPFGEYFVYIDLDSYAFQGTTSYAIEIRWHGCSDRLE